MHPDGFRLRSVARAILRLAQHTNSNSSSAPHRCDSISSIRCRKSWKHLSPEARIAPCQPSTLGHWFHLSERLAPNAHHSAWPPAAPRPSTPNAAHFWEVSFSILSTCAGGSIGTRSKIPRICVDDCMHPLVTKELQRSKCGSFGRRNDHSPESRPVVSSSLSGTTYADGRA